MDITVAIVCSSDPLLPKCLKSIPDEYPIIVVLNFPSDTVLHVVENDKRVNVIRCDERNLGKLRQAAVNQCKTPKICFIDSDCTFEKNALTIIGMELDSSLVVNIPMHYSYYNAITKTVSKCRCYTTPDQLLYMPMAFNLSVQKIIGPFFNEKLVWGEDSDQRERLSKHGIVYSVSKTIIWHKPLTLKEDAKSAKKLGFGVYVQETNGLIKPRKITKDLSIIHEAKSAYKCYKKVGLSAALYHFFIWRPVFKTGYWKEKIKNGCQNTDSSQ